jgi:ketosteroid isomerase-like protein
MEALDLQVSLPFVHAAAPSTLRHPEDKYEGTMNNIEKLQHAYQVWHDGRGANEGVWLELMAEDVVLRSLGGGVAALDFSATRHGRAEAEFYFADLRASWEMIYYAADEFIAEDDRVVMVGRCAWRSRVTGKAGIVPHPFRPGGRTFNPGRPRRRRWRYRL